MKRLPHEAALWQWLIKAAKCSAIDIARGRKRYSALLARFGEFLRRTPTDADAGESLHDALEVALGKLDAGERELIEEKYFQRRTLDEIARTRGFTAKAVERRLARVRERLRTTISNHLKAEQLP